MSEEKDKEDYENEIREYSRRMKIQAKQVKIYEAEIIKLKAENVIITKRMEAAFKDTDNIRMIMTNNITDSNEKTQSLLGEINSLRTRIRLKE
jgi:hypothetical protein